MERRSGLHGAWFHVSMIACAVVGLLWFVSLQGVAALTLSFGIETRAEASLGYGTLAFEANTGSLNRAVYERVGSPELLTWISREDYEEVWATVNATARLVGNQPDYYHGFKPGLHIDRHGDLSGLSLVVPCWVLLMILMAYPVSCLYRLVRGRGEPRPQISATPGDDRLE